MCDVSDALTVTAMATTALLEKNIQQRTRRPRIRTVDAYRTLDIVALALLIVVAIEESGDV